MNNFKQDKYKCEFCKMTFAHGSSLCRHRNKWCNKKLVMEKHTVELGELLENKDEEITILQKKIDKLLKKIEKLEKELKNKDKQMIENLTNDKIFYQENQKTASSTITKSVDALSFLVTHRKTAPELRQLTQETANSLLTHETRLYDYLLHHNDDNTLDQYLGKIILKHIKKENPDEQSVWNSDVSRLTYIIRDIVNESAIWLRDPNGAIFNDKIILPITTAIKKYLERCLYSKNPNRVEIDGLSEDESSEENAHDNRMMDLYDEREKMRRTGRIVSAIETVRSAKFRKSLSEYIASRIPIQKADSLNIANSDTKQILELSESKPKKVCKDKSTKKAK